MANRVTTQNIADALGISRNTVSKAINNTGVLAPATRQKVLDKAREMGYRQFSWTDTVNAEEPQSRAVPVSAEKPVMHQKKIVLLTTSYLNESHFASTMLDKFQSEIRKAGYELSMCMVAPDEIRNRQLPSSFNPDQAAGIICYETFDQKYADMICSLDLPVLFVDAPVSGLDAPLRADRLFMDSQTGISQLIRGLIDSGIRKIGFIGEIAHCQSFFERYLAYRNMLLLHHIEEKPAWSITGHQKDPSRRAGDDYREYLLEQLRDMDELPEVFVCANDFVALDVMRVLHTLGLSVPKDIFLTGFDDSPDSQFFSPRLTTVHINSQIMGYSAAHLLISRICNPFLNYRTVYTETNPVWRESTGKAHAQ